MNGEKFEIIKFDNFAKYLKIAPRTGGRFFCFSKVLIIFRDLFERLLNTILQIDLLE